MREFRQYGSVRGALRNERPYREHHDLASVECVSGLRGAEIRCKNSPLSSAQLRHTPTGAKRRVWITGP